MSRRIALLLEETPTARAVLLEKHGLVTWGETGEESYESTIEFVSRAARAIDDGGAGPVRAGRPARPRSSGTGRSHALLAQSLPALRGALLADADGVVLEVDRSPEAVAFASAARTRRGEPDRRAVPRPPDQHEAQAARRRLRPATDDGAPSSPTRSARGVERVRATGTATTTSATSTTRRGSSRSTRPARASSSSRASASSRAGARRGPRARRARPLPPGDRGRGRRRRARRVPLAERERGVRDRVLAARALQARAGAAARRARRPRRADHRRRERHRPRDRAPARRARRARRRRRPQPRRRRGGRRRARRSRVRASAGARRPRRRDRARTPSSR